MPDTGCCCRIDYDVQFDAEEARRDLLNYRQAGPDPTTQRLLDALVAQGVEGATLLDIGGGIGSIQLELLSAGVERCTDVDASGPYLDTAESEARDRGLADRVRYLHGDFVALADEVTEADIVTLDRVVCCYPDARRLIGLSALKARRLYGLVHPVDRWWTRMLGRLGNAGYRLFRNPYRMHIHPQALIDELVLDAGLVPVHAESSWFWRIALYRRPT